MLTAIRLFNVIVMSQQHVNVRFISLDTSLVVFLYIGNRYGVEARLESLTRERRL